MTDPRENENPNLSNPKEEPIEEGNPLKEKPIISPKTKQISKDIAKGAFTVLTKMVKITIR